MTVQTQAADFVGTKRALKGNGEAECGGAGGGFCCAAAICAVPGWRVTAYRADARPCLHGFARAVQVGRAGWVQVSVMFFLAS